ncbi:cytochrome P450 [Hysterangium stoloniferum]|nr:cytochrome P450 [Hysterangium stoloniferum]
MFNTLSVLLAWFIYPSLVLLSLVLVYAVSGLVQLMVTQYFSHLGALGCPPVPSFFWGHLQLLHDAENTNVYNKWREELGSIFTYRGFIGGYRLVTMDPRAIIHILSKPDHYPKPSFVRDSLASMGGEYGLIVVEGDDHKRMRKIINPSFTSPQVRELTPIFYEKAVKLRDIWLSLIDTASSSPTEIHNPPSILRHTDKPFHLSFLSPATPILPLRSRSRTNKVNITSPSPSLSLPSSYSSTSSIRLDILSWLGRATLDVIGLAGFGYTFDALVDDQNELAAAFADVFSAARKFRVLTVLQVWFPILRYFRPNRMSTESSLRTMQRIGRELVYGAQSRMARKGEEYRDIDFREKDPGKEARLSTDGDGALKGRDLLSLLIKSNLASEDKDRMSEDEIISQISTFMVAGHETTSSALAWTLYTLSHHQRSQSILRAELLSIPFSPMPSPEAISALPYLDMVVRESLRLFSPISQTMRIATKDDIVPVSGPYRDRKGQKRIEIVIKKGDIITIPIQAMNKCKCLFGDDAEMFVPERWKDDPPDPSHMPTLYSNILTFLHGGRGCIGYKFALLEMKVFLFILLRDIIFQPYPGLVIEKRLNVVTRPLVKSEPERGNQMPLLLSRTPSATIAIGPPPHPGSL